jgi:hypothetical protein
MLMFQLNVLTDGQDELPTDDQSENASQSDINSDDEASFGSDGNFDEAEVIAY